MRTLNHQELHKCKGGSLRTFGRLIDRLYLDAIDHFHGEGLTTTTDTGAVRHVPVADYIRRYLLDIR